MIALATLYAHDRPTMRKDVGAINRIDNWVRNTWTDASDKSSLRNALIKIVDELEPIIGRVERDGYSVAQLAYLMDQVPCSTRLDICDDLYRELVEADNPIVVETSNSHYGTPYKRLLQQIPITCVPVGVMLSNLQNNIRTDEDDNRPQELDGLKPVFMSMNSRGAILFRGWRGRIVPENLIAYCPGADHETVRLWLSDHHARLEVSLLYLSEPLQLYL